MISRCCIAFILALALVGCSGYTQAPDSSVPDAGLDAVNGKDVAVDRSVPDAAPPDKALPDKSVKLDIDLEPGQALPYEEEKQIAKYEKAYAMLQNPIANPWASSPACSIPAVNLAENPSDRSGASSSSSPWPLGCHFKPS